MINPDTQQNILYTAYFLVLHNFFALLFAFGIVCSVAWAIYRPSRPAVLMIVGFSLLLLGFEYNKHIMEPLMEQTKNSLITERQSYRIARVVEIVLGKLLPVGFYAAGLASVGIATFLLSFRKTPPKQSHT